jgi:hypothetical protein
MKELVIIAIWVFSFKIISLSSGSPVSDIHLEQQETQGEKLMAQLLELIKSNDKTKAQQFIVANYCDPCLAHTPLQTHLAVLTNLQAGFSDLVVTQKKTKGYKSAVIIQSPKTKKMKLLIIEIDKNNGQKIFEFSARDFSGDAGAQIQL